MKLLPLLALGALMASGSVTAATINVPSDQSTIQAAINAASNGDTVLVAPGTYFEKLDYLGKAITVQSSGGASVTILDGNNTGPIVTFQHSETTASVLQGFTLTHGFTSNAGFGAAIYLSSTSPTITDNVFEYNQGGDGYSGAAIYGYGAPVILRNLFAGNTCGLQFNSGVVVLLSGTAGVIADNVFADNPCPALIVSLGTSTVAKIYNNTIVGNRVGLSLSSFGTNASTFFSNNLIAFNQYGVQVTLVNGGTFPTWSHNLVYGNSLVNYQGVTDQTGSNGNISADPVLKYWPSGDVHLLTGSPAIDAGDSSVTQASATDFYGDARVFAGILGDSAIVDIGAAESITADAVPGTPNIINVPADYPTIQAGIDAASVGDVVSVAPGTYYEQPNFKGKAITVKSSGGAAATILDGQNSGPIVSFVLEGSVSVLQGFTFTHAKVENGGAAINIKGPAAPTIVDDVFEDNYAYGGPAISMFGGAGSPTILRNRFVDNVCSNSIDDPSQAVVEFEGDSPTIADNVFVNNACPALFIGAGSVYNNTMVGNRQGIISPGASKNAPMSFSNNLIAFNNYGLSVTLINGAVMAGWSHNLVYGNATADYRGVASQTGSNGNISADPVLKYWLGGDVHLLTGSAAIDAGDSSVNQLSATDLYGAARVFAGIQGDSAVVDIGAAESIAPDAVPGVAPVINVPADQTTIQAGIDAAVDGDIVLVAPGIYYELLDFDGKVITLKSSGGTAVTILDGNNAGPIINFRNSEWIYSVLQGFTLTHARNDDVSSFGAAVNLNGNSPTIEDNVFVDNFDAVGQGGAIGGNGASPVIIRNYFTGNSGADFSDNPFSVIYLVNESSPVVADNVFVNNSVIAYYQLGGGAPKLYNNTMVGNAVGLYASIGIDPSAFARNNIIAFNQIGVRSWSIDGSVLPPFKDNLVYGNTTANYSGVADQTGTNGNISVDPQLKDWAAADVSLIYGSPAIDVGDSAVSQVSSTDFFGSARVFAGMPGDTAIVDLGAAEYAPPVVMAAAGSVQAISGLAKIGTLGASGADSTEPLTFVLASLPTHGSVMLTNSKTGAFKYTSVQGYAGSDSFTFYITDPYGTVSNTATEQVTVGDVAPTANAGSVYTPPGATAVGTLSATAAYAGQKLTFSLISSPAHGNVSLTAGSGQFHYVPAADYAGTDSFSFEVTDQLGLASNTAIEQVTVSDVAATALDGVITVRKGRYFTGALTATPGYPGQILTFVLVRPPAHGTLNLKAATGVFHYKADDHYIGPDSFTFEVVDSGGTVSNVATMSITVTP